MPLGAARQTSLYYARKRTRDARAVPRLFQTAEVLQGASENVFKTEDYSVSISFGTKIDLSQTGAVFSLGTFIEVTQDATTILFRYRTKTISVPKPPSGLWDIVLAIRPDGEMRFWTPVGLAGVAKGVVGAWGAAGALLAAAGTLAAPLRVYSCQLPRRFFGVTVETTDNLLFNTTLVGFLSGFQTPALEDGGN